VVRSLLLSLAAALAPLALAAAELHPEQQLIEALDDLRAGKTDAARKELDRLVQRQPNFHLARLFYKELQAARLDAKAPFFSDATNPEVRDLAAEARVRLERRRPPAGALPDAVLQLAPGSTHAVVVDLNGARLYLLEHKDGRLELGSDFYAAIGKNGTGKRAAGDQRTPVGIYGITGFIGDDKLPELYGMGAFPLDYPNLWDRRERRTGSGIWLHGVPRDTYVRAPRSSDGCVTLANDDLRALKPFLVAGRTPVVFSDALDWAPRADLERDRAAFLAVIDDWRGRWSKLDTEGYLAFYADDFEADGMKRGAFAAHKRRVNKGKKFVDVKLSDVELFRYPGQEPLMLARFRQDYRSDNHKRVTLKQQFWRRSSDQRWKIVREESQ